ncbi:Cdc25b catalytic domain without Ion in catalytic site [Cladochytrium replicatum]|nr:Cdc25b catalytic domain without Ion in catalytic site [Cladochytrium replicatum]
MVSEPVESTSEKFLLPCFDTKKDAFPRISGQTIVELLNGRFTELIDDFYIIDCRFSYEYAYGHILHARNITTSGDLETLFFEPLPAATRNRTVLIFHCEYSSQRAPTMAQHLRSHDRSVNTYPNLCYPHVYVLEGGYRNFWSEYRSMCNPDGYREMDERGWSKECALGMKGYRREFKKAKSFAGPELRREAW